MKKQCKYYLIFSFLILCIQSSAVCSVEVEEIIESQKEIQDASKEVNKESLSERKLLAETKDALKMGSEEYQQSCSICHGISAEGHSEYASVLKKRPIDLTQIKKSNKGVFPFSKLYRIIDGREEIASHGTRIMPIWGDRFNAENWLNMSPRYSETFVRGRIFELLLYLESIQK